MSLALKGGRAIQRLTQHKDEGGCYVVGNKLHNGAPAQPGPVSYCQIRGAREGLGASLMSLFVYSQTLSSSPDSDPIALNIQ